MEWNENFEVRMSRIKPEFLKKLEGEESYAELCRTIENQDEEDFSMFLHHK